MPLILTWLIWLVGSVVGLLVLYFVALAVIAVVRGVRGAPDGVEVAVVAPGSAVVDSPFEIQVRVTSGAQQEHVVYAVDIGTKYLKGIVIESVEPTPVDSDKGMGFHTEFFKHKLAPTMEFVARIKCKAVHAGDFAADLDVTINGSGTIVTRPIRTVVREVRD